MTLRILLILFVLASLAGAQTGSDIASHPHYHSLLENDQVRVYSLTLHPTEEAYVRHEHSFLTVTLEDCEVVLWQGTQSAIQHFQVHEGEVGFVFVSAPKAAGIRNVSQSEYRNITVEFLDPKFGWAAPNGGGIGPPPDRRAKFSDSIVLGGANVSDVQLLAGDSLTTPKRGVAELFIAVSEVELTGAGDLSIRKSPGAVAWLPPGRKSDLVNAGSGPAHFVIVEIQPAD